MNQRAKNMHRFFNVRALQAGVKAGQKNGERDAFRHIYASALSSMLIGSAPTHVAGSALEWITHAKGKIKHMMGYQDRSGQPVAEGNPTQEWQMDEHNNALGRQLAERARQEGWNEPRLLAEIGYLIRSGQAKVIKDTPEPEPSTGYPGYNASQPPSMVLSDAEARQRATARGDALFAPKPPAQTVQETTQSPWASLLDYFKKRR